MVHLHLSQVASFLPRPPPPFSLQTIVGVGDSGDPQDLCSPEALCGMMDDNRALIKDWCGLVRTAEWPSHTGLNLHIAEPSLMAT